MDKLKKNDTVVVLAGKDKGKKGKVLMVFPGKGRAIVEGVNYVKKHTRRTKEDQKGGILKKESPIHLSNLAIFCQRCNRPSKVGIAQTADGNRAKFCKKCKELL